MQKLLSINLDRERRPSICRNVLKSCHLVAKRTVVDFSKF